MTEFPTCPKCKAWKMIPLSTTTLVNGIVVVLPIGKWKCLWKKCGHEIHAYED